MVSVAREYVQYGPIYLSEVSFCQVTKDVIMPEIWERCAKLYCDIWRESPWNEDFWEPRKVLWNTLKELKRFGAEGFIATQTSTTFTTFKRSTCYELEVVGFSWGYAVNRKELLEISGSGCLDKLFESEDRVFYIDELAVHSKKRGEKIGFKLNQLLIEAAQKQGFRIITLRTDKKAVAAKNLYLKAGFRDLQIEDAAYPNRTYWKLEI